MRAAVIAWEFVLELFHAQATLALDHWSISKEALMIKFNWLIDRGHSLWYHKGWRLNVGVFLIISFNRCARLNVYYAVRPRECQSRGALALLTNIVTIDSGIAWCVIVGGGVCWVHLGHSCWFLWDWFVFLILNFLAYLRFLLFCRIQFLFLHFNLIYIWSGYSRGMNFINEVEIYTNILS